MKMSVHRSLYQPKYSNEYRILASVRVLVLNENGVHCLSLDKVVDHIFFFFFLHQGTSAKCTSFST